MPSSCRFSLQFDDKHAPTLSFVFFDRLFVDEAKCLPSRRLPNLRDKVAVFGHKEPGRSHMIGLQEYVDSHLIRTLCKALGAHVPRRRTHGLHLNGLGWRVARPYEHEMLLASRKLNFESSSRQLSQTRCSAAETRDFRFLLFFTPAISPIASPARTAQSDGREQRTAIAPEALRRAPFLLVSHPFVGHGVAHGVHGAAHGVRGASTGGGSSRGSRWSQQAPRRAQPPVLRPPTALAPTIA
jgi:hypothetical protein